MALPQTTTLYEHHPSQAHFQLYLRDWLYSSRPRITATSHNDWMKPMIFVALFLQSSIFPTSAGDTEGMLQETFFVLVGRRVKCSIVDNESLLLFSPSSYSSQSCNSSSPSKTAVFLTRIVCLQFKPAAPLCQCPSLTSATNAFSFPREKSEEGLPIVSK
jgi:hypothetical protein